jgi:predicted O-methyltransferase YrrM
MSRIRNLARPAFEALPPQAQNILRKLYYTKSNILLWPLKSKLNHDVTRLEWRKSDRNLRKLLEFPEMERSTWRGLGSLAYELVRHYRPKTIVELGTYVGFSAFSMGLALRGFSEGGKLYAVDTWEGDDHMGNYGENIYRTFLSRRADLELDSVIVPLRTTFDDARDKVPDQIDLLHIDGLHTWEAINHDFETFGPRVSPGGFIVFHDVNSEFEGVRRFWSIISQRYASYMVPYSFGLGIIRV